MKKLMELKNKKDHNVVHIMMVYRYSLLIITSIIYILTKHETSFAQVSVVLIGLIAASITITHLYFIYKENRQFINILFDVEMVCNSVIMVVSGGFISPFIWYFISALLIGMIDLSTQKVVIMSTLYFFVACITTFISNPDVIHNMDMFRLNINMALSYLLVIYVMRQIIQYASNVQKKSEELAHTNEMLTQAKNKIENTLKSSMEIYETVNLFSIKNKKRAYQELNEHFCNLVEVKECMLLRLDPINEYGEYESYNIGECKSKQLKECILSGNLDNWKKEQLFGTRSTVNNYAALPIHNGNEIYGMFLFPWSKEFKMEHEIEIFINLAAIILKKIDYDEVGEQLIISEEQNRIANEIHDIVLQKLFAITCKLYLLDNKCKQLEDSQLKSDIRGELSDTKNAVGVTMKELREAIYGLSWEKDGQDYFIVKLRNYLNEMMRLHEIVIELMIEGDTQNITVSQKTAIFRIICEAVNNSIRHGNAKKVKTNVIIQKEKIELEVIDEGKGFKKHDNEILPKEGLGIHNMMRIAKLFEGTFDIESKIEKGTRVSVTLLRGSVS